MFDKLVRIKRLVITGLFCIPYCAGAQSTNNALTFDNANPFYRDISDIQVSDIDYDLFKANLMFSVIKSFAYNCRANDPNISDQILERAMSLFYEEKPELYERIIKTDTLWEEVNPLTNDAGNLDAIEINTLHMIKELHFIIQGNEVDVSSTDCQSFLSNISDTNRQNAYWDNYLNQVIPIIKEANDF